MRIDDHFNDGQFYPNNVSKIQRQQNINMDHIDEVNYQSQYDHHLQSDTLLYSNHQMTVSELI